MWSFPKTRQRKTDKKYSQNGSPKITQNNATVICLLFTCWGGWGRVWTLIRPILVLGALKLHFEALHPDLEPIHGLDGRLSARWVVEAHKSCNSNSTVCEIFQNYIQNQGLIEIFFPFLSYFPLNLQRLQSVFYLRKRWSHDHKLNLSQNSKVVLLWKLFW